MRKPDDLNVHIDAVGNFIYGKVKPETSAGAKDGTAISASIIDDLWYAFLAVLNAAGVPPSGSVEDTANSDFLDALNTLLVGILIDEDDMASDSAVLAPTQQSVKAYVTSQVGAFAMKHSGVVVHTGVVNTGAYVDLSLTSKVGANRALVYLKLSTVSGGAHLGIRTKGNTFVNETDARYHGQADTYIASANTFQILTAITDINGVVEMKGHASYPMGASDTITLLAYQVLA